MAAALAAAAVCAFPASSLAAATVEPVSITAPIVPELIDDTCAGAGVVGLATGTETLSGHTIETKTGSHFAGSSTIVFRVDFPDGSYLTASQREPLTFNGNPLVGQTTLGSTLLEKGTLYDANGVLIAYEIFHARFRITIVDGVAVVEFDEGHLTCR